MRGAVQVSAALRRAVPPAVVAVVFGVLGHPVPAVVLVGVALVLVVTGLAAPGAAEALDRGVLRAAEALASAVSFVALGAVWVLLVAPAWLIGRVLRRDVLRPRGVEAGTGWSARDGAAEGGLVRRGFVDESGLGARPEGGLQLSRRVPLVAGCVVALVLLDLGLGWSYDEVLGSHDVPEEAARGGTPEDLAASPAMAGADWADEYWAEFAALDHRYEPYVLSVVEDAGGPLITVDDGARKSYEPAGLDDDHPVVWFFGGGATFGQGQRDDHTIPSAFAREAEAAGRPVEVVNFGAPGHTTWQQWQWFERLLAVRAAPAMAVFLGGYDDVRAQLEGPSPDPTHYNVVGADRSLTGDPPPTDLGELFEEYQDHSLLTRLARNVRNVVGATFVGTAHAAPQGDADAATYAADHHERARLFLDHLADREGVTVVQAWQPAPVDGPVRGPYLDMIEQRGGDVLDLSGALDGRADLHIDDVNVNEAGAAIVGRALYEALAAELADGP